MKKKCHNDFQLAITFGHNQGWDTRCSNCRAKGVTFLVDVDLALPTAPDFSRGEHASTTTHVTVSSLTGTVSTTSSDAGNTGDSTTGTP